MKKPYNLMFGNRKKIAGACRKIWFHMKIEVLEGGFIYENILYSFCHSVFCY